MSSATRVRVAAVDEFEEDGYKIVAIGRKEFGIFRYRGGFVAYLNHCPHAGGPVCQGKRIARVHEKIADDKTSAGLSFSEDHHIVCPWHGWEFDLGTGQHPGDPRMKLRAVEVIVDGGEVYLNVPSRATVPA